VAVAVSRGQVLAVRQFLEQKSMLKSSSVVAAGNAMVALLVGISCAFKFETELLK
jgi:hypothetical protein